MEIMRLRTVGIAIVLSAAFSVVKAQSIVDSLVKQLPTASKLEQLNLSLEIADLKTYDSTFERYAEEAILLAKSLRLPKKEARALTLLSTFKLTKVLRNKNQLEKAVLHAEKAKAIALNIHDSTEYFYALCQIIICRLRKSDWVQTPMIDPVTISQLEATIRYAKKQELNYLMARAYFALQKATVASPQNLDTRFHYSLEALKVCDSVRYPNLKARIYNTLGSIAAESSSNGNSIVFFTKALNLITSTNDRYVESIILANIADYYQQKGEKKQTIDYYERALNLSLSAGMQDRVVSVYSNLAKAYWIFGDYRLAISVENKAIELFKKLGLENDANLAYGTLAFCHAKLNDRINATRELRIFENALEEYIHTNGDFPTIRYYFQEATKIYRLLGDLKNEVRLSERLMALTDSVLTTEMNARIEKIEFQHQLELKNKEVELLKVENEFHQRQVKDEKLMRYALLAIILMALACVGVQIVNRRKLKRLYLNLEQSSKTINDQKQELQARFEELSVMHRQMLNSEKMAALGQLTAGIAHEINNPLNFISGGVTALNEMMENTFANNEKTHYQREDLEGMLKDSHDLIRSVSVGVDRISMIVRGLTIFSHPGEALNPSANASLRECFESVLALQASKIKENNILLVKKWENVQVASPTGRLSQVFMNLIENAIHALQAVNDRDRKIEIRSRNEGANVIIEVEDNGIGIPEEIRESVFNAFFTTKAPGKGTGLGLYIVHTIVEELGGKLSFESEPGKGTKFILTLTLFQPRPH